MGEEFAKISQFSFSHTKPHMEVDSALNLDFCFCFVFWHFPGGWVTKPGAQERSTVALLGKFRTRNVCWQGMEYNTKSVQREET